ncbi:Dienelactone hydrolase [Streptoalloteichus tenebrarius]|uniref:Dienelactone hydrolase n=1 Tax=Streptoalloteichus tenebrarius (strain ATCC 17920 / DSM 40477 / JCM 4838 / CBS 697.72 / NBRC 16177 / NCIMB 11028 / NRRL B-12390 / A12253. 1 / ISP 5477) TaxID=1933 RepID=A0ABT1HXH0_STRSD|nr:alpha/beta hydrolase [Streptoalloteichus tenebrarius]MCP2260196.1 Dienelactone hydrolase [Streptoalloteichus tenebrarius]BFF02602.1 dienelactone hydrolase [Streptoalloteichus tenebrarius]
MARTAKQALEELSRPGPHEVLHGDLGLVGLPGLVLTPRSGLGLPAVAFGHGWMQPPQRYRELMRHLASWGIVVAAPATQRGPLASHRLFAADLSTALDVCAGVRLGDGGISVDPERLGVAGHSFGAGCAVLAAAQDERVRAVATLAPAESRPSALAVAGRCRMPALHVAAGRDRLAPSVAHAEPLARAWAGPVTLRTVGKATHLGFTEGRHYSDLLLDGAPERGTRRLARALLTAFFLRHLAGRRDYDVLLSEDVRGCPIDLTRGPLAGAAAR